jgi:hypothetical protein
VEGWSSIRDVLLFLLGVLGVAHQTLVAPTPSESLLVLFAACLGLPAFLRADEKRTANGKD